MIDLLLIMEFLDDPTRESEFLQMYFHYHKTLINIAMTKVHNIHIAEECVQDAMIIVAKNFKKIDEPVSTKTKRYVSRIVEHVAIDAFHKEIERPVATKEFDESSFWQQAEARFADDFEAQELKMMLQTLPEDVQTYLSLHYSDKMTLKEIGQMFDISYYKLSRKINEALEKLKGEENE